MTAFALLLKTFAEDLDAQMGRMLSGSHRLDQAMRHSAVPSGKAIRGFLVRESLHLAGFPKDAFWSVAAAFELFHTYSLIHDDLPCMDNAALRRGRPTCHLAFDEAIAVLAGDALQAEAFALLSDPNPVFEVQGQIRLIHRLAMAAGHCGMALGQAMDIAGTVDTLQALKTMHGLKTGVLIQAAAMAGGLLRGDDALMHTMETFGRLLGLAFQVRDDLLDIEGCPQETGKTTGQDHHNQRVTFVTLLGSEGSQALLYDLETQAGACLATLPNAGYLPDLLSFVIQRRW
ncbi:MAG: polyprenyl synthetase family protein [Alphaproteobacteria bacterium]